MIKIIKEETEGKFNNYFIKQTQQPKTLCIRYRKRTKDFTLYWCDSNWIVNNNVLRFKSMEDAERFLEDNPIIKESPYGFGPATIGKSRNAFELVEIELETEYNTNVPVYVSTTYIAKNVPNEENQGDRELKEDYWIDDYGNYHDDYYLIVASKDHRDQIIGVCTSRSSADKWRREHNDDYELRGIYVTIKKVKCLD